MGFKKNKNKFKDAKEKEIVQTKLLLQFILCQFKNIQEKKGGKAFSNVFANLVHPCLKLEAPDFVKYYQVNNKYHFIFLHEFLLEIIGAGRAELFFLFLLIQPEETLSQNVIYNNVPVNHKRKRY